MTTKVLEEIAAERQRQIDVEGWTPDHDDEHDSGQMAQAAAAYCLASSDHDALAVWPWSRDWWKPTTERRNLVKAAALIVAEIERRDRGGEVSDYWVTVCARCGQSSCWLGIFLCHRVRGAGVKDVLASKLDREKREHPDHYSRETLMEHCGEVRDAVFNFENEEEVGDE